MGDITLKIRGDFSQARKAFSDLAESSEETREQMEKFAESLTASELEEFNRKQKRIQDSMRGTRGETAALEQSSRNYQRQIEQLIRQGFDPNSTAVRELTREQQRLQKEVDASRKAKERKTKALKAAKKALKASAVAIAGVVTGVIALTKRNANLANGLANSARVVGLTTEAYQELDYAMRMNGIENGDYMLNRLARSVIDVRNETGTLTKFLENNYNELLAQLQAVENNEEAFTLLMDAIHRAPNEFAAAELAMAAFGRNGAQMVLVAQNGAEGMNALREEARQLGVVSNENAQAAMAFNDAMFRLRTSVQNMTQELTVKLLPALTNVVVRVTNTIQRAGEFRARLEGLRGVVTTVVPVVAGLTAGVTAFVGTMKAVGYITVFINKLNALRNAMKATKVATLIAAAAHKVYVKVKSLGKAAVPAIIAGGAALVCAFIGIRNALRNAANEAMEFNKVFEDIEFPDFNFVAESIADLDVALTKLSWGGAAIEATLSAYDKALRQRLDMVRDSANQEKNNNINILQRFLVERARLEADSWEERKAFLDKQKQYLLDNGHVLASEQEALEEAHQRAIRELQTSALDGLLRERLEGIKKTENQINNYQINTIQSFLAQRLQLESKDWDERYAFLKEKLQVIKEYEQFSADERYLIEQELHNKIEALREERVRSAREATRNMLKSYSVFFGGLGKMLGVAGRENRRFFVASRAMALVQSVINTKLAVTKALSTGGIIKAIGVGLKGAAATAKIASSIIPSAETGGRFIVPPSRGVDNSIMRVNEGETVEVTPRGMTGGEISQYIFKIGEQVIFDIVNKGGRSGDISVFEPAANF